MMADYKVTGKNFDPVLATAISEAEAIRIALDMTDGHYLEIWYDTDAESEYLGDASTLAQELDLDLDEGASR